MTIAEESRFVLHGLNHRFPLTVPARASLQVGFGVEHSESRRTQEVVFRVLFEDGQGRRPLLTQPVAAPSRPRDAEWGEVDIPLDALSGQRGVIILEVLQAGAAPADGTGIFWTNPIISAESRSDGRPNIILLSIDTLRADHLGCYGYERNTSPTIDRVAREGVRFANAIAPSSWTLPSHASLFSGLNPSEHGSERRGLLADELTTLVELLWDAGYRTAAFTGGGYVAPAFGLDQGFDRYRGWRTFLMRRPGEFRLTLERGMRWAASQGNHRFFLFLHTYAVHLPYTPPLPYDSIFDPNYTGPYRRKFLARDYLRLAPAEYLPADELRQVEALYDGEIAYVNAILGDLVKFLATGPLAANTCLIITSDHGEEFKEHGNLLHHHAKLYEELIRVPLIFWCPSKFPGGRVVDEPVSLVDVLPTVLALAGLPAPERCDGRSLYPALMGRALPRGRTVLCEVEGSIERKAGSVVALRTSEAKLIHSTVGGSTSRMLFDLREDPRELRNLIERPPAAARPLGTELEKILERRAAAPSDATPAPTPALGEAVRERLRALGYQN